MNNLKQVKEIHYQKMKDIFNSNNIDMVFLDNKESLIEYLLPYLNNISVGVGGSMTLFETGIIDLLRKQPINFLDRYDKSLSREEVVEVFRQSLLCDLYLTSSNAITLDGGIYNIDGTGNRVAAMIYGPKKVFIIVGRNKIFLDEESAIKHIKTVSAPANAIRLNRNTPCAKTGKCMDCHSNDRICSEYTKIVRQANAGRMTILVVDEDLGY